MTEISDKDRIVNDAPPDTPSPDAPASGASSAGKPSPDSRSASSPDDIVESVEVDFEQLFHELESPLVRYAMALVRNLEQAQDIAQEAFLRLHKELSKRGGKFTGKPSSWLYRVAHNLAMDHLRKEGRARAHREKTIMEHQNTGGVAAAHGPDAARREGERLARERLKELPEREQQVVLLKVEQEKTYKEIAEIMQLTVGNVGYILHHALKKLAVQLKEEGAV